MTRLKRAPSLATLRSPWSTRIRALALTLACASLPCLADAALAADTASAAPPDPAPPVEAPSKDAISYQVVIDAPREFHDTLTQSVDLIRWQSYADMTEELLDRLAWEAVEQAREAVATSGYFTASIDVAVDRRTTPITVTLKIDPGPPTHVSSVDIGVTGPAESDPGVGAEAIGQLRTDWGLPEGAVFRQNAWDSAKTRAVATLASNAYASASLQSSEARIDPEKQEADLSVKIASGPPFHIGELQVTGLGRYDPELVRSYSTFQRGQLYSGAELDQYLRRLNATGYFASARAQIDTDPAHADDAPITVAVIEGPTRTLEGGVGYTTDTEFRINASYRDVNVGNSALRFYTDLRLETLLQSATIRFVQPPGSTGWVNSCIAKYEHTTLNELVTRTSTVGFRRASLDETAQWQYGVAYLDDKQMPQGAEPSASHAVYADVERTWRRVDDLVSPTRGWILDLQAGAGVPGVSTRGFERVIARFAAWYPPSRDWQLSGKLEAGAVLGASRQEVPSALMFRTGGDTTVRGYAFESLGVKDGDATVPGRYYTVASVEATRWLNPTIGIAAFVDAGNAFDEATHIHLAIGYGMGVRVRTPIGPFRFDVAYGEDSRQVRVHFSVGLAF